MIRFPDIICDDHQETITILCLEDQCTKRILCANCYCDFHQQHNMMSINLFIQNYQKYLSLGYTSNHYQQMQEKFISYFHLIVFKKLSKTPNRVFRGKDILQRISKRSKSNQIFIIRLFWQGTLFEKFSSELHLENENTFFNLENLVEQFVRNRSVIQNQDEESDQTYQKYHLNLLTIQEELQNLNDQVIFKLSELQQLVDSGLSQGFNQSNQLNIQQKKESKAQEKKLAQYRYQVLNLTIQKQQPNTIIDLESNQDQQNTTPIVNQVIQNQINKIENNTPSLEKVIQGQPQIVEQPELNINDHQYLIQFKLMKSIDILNTPIRGLCFIDDSRICFYSDDSTLYYCNLNQGMEVQRISQCQARITSICVKNNIKAKTEIMISSLDGYGYIFRIERTSKDRLVHYQKTPLLHSNGVNFICLSFNDRCLISVGFDSVFKTIFYYYYEQTMKEWSFGYQDPQEFRISEQVSSILCTQKYIYCGAQSNLYIFLSSNRYLIKRINISRQVIARMLLLNEDSNILLVILKDGSMICQKFTDERLFKLFETTTDISVLHSIHIQNLSLVILGQNDDKQRSELQFYIYNKDYTLSKTYKFNLPNLSALAGINSSGNNQIACGDNSGSIKIFRL